MVCGFIGNFSQKYTTEQDRKWSLRMLGHDVVTFQENETSPYTLLRYAEENKLDVLFYSHTHDPAYVIKDLINVFKVYKEKGIPTASIHLDRWAGLERQKDVGQEATWFTEYQFMADGSPEAVEMYEKLHLKWYWIKPGVIERDCYLAHADPIRFPHEIVFVGSKGYHKEYPFRAELIEFLHKTYGARFGHYGPDGIEVVRGHDLNTLFASCKVVVGDSCFGGRPKYVSDRYYETRGRGGFLIHPWVEGIDIKGVANYQQGNLDSLKEQIDYYLGFGERRNGMQLEGFGHVRCFETYTDRMREIMEVIYGN